MYEPVPPTPTMATRSDSSLALSAPMPARLDAVSMYSNTDSSGSAWNAGNGVGVDVGSITRAGLLRMAA
jgi:hypothetical protein